MNLSNSRWAPASHRHNNQAYPHHSTSPPASGTSTPINPPPTTNTTSSTKPALTKPQRSLLTRHTDLLKFSKLLRRLKWKSRGLLFSHHRALHERSSNVVGQIGWPMEAGEAETMFKIDFFEFYVLLERVLVHLLGAFGMVVAPSYGRVDEDGLREEADAAAAAASSSTSTGVNPGETGDEPRSLREELLERDRRTRGLVGDSMVFHGYTHRFHANVLAALDLPSNPLHEYLGSGSVRDYLGIAKEFRNRWKDAEEKPTEDGLVGSRYEKMLNDLKLEEMLGEILVAVESARPVAEAEVERFAGEVGGGVAEAMMELDVAIGGGEWEAMPDAMDWD